MIFTTSLFLAISCCSFAYGQYSERAVDLLNRAYSGERNPDGKFIAELKAEAFDEPSTGKFALIQTYSATEQPELVRECVRMARELAAAEPDGCRRDMAMIILSPLLALNGEPRAGAKLAEQSLATMDFKRFPHSDDPFIRFLGNRFGVGSFGWERFLKDNLRLQFGGYYLNRDRDDGEPDLEKGTGIFPESRPLTTGSGPCPMRGSRISGIARPDKSTWGRLRGSIHVPCSFALVWDFRWRRP